MSLESATAPIVRFSGDHLPSDVASRLRRGEWLRLRRGAYIDAHDPLDDIHRRHELELRGRIVAVNRSLAAHACFSHTTAALVWGLPTWGLPNRVHITSPTRPSVRRGSDVVRHVAIVDDADRTRVAGLSVTTLARTTLDCVMTSPPVEGLIVADAALRAGLDLPDVVGRLEQRAGHRGVRRARELFACADTGAESPGESQTRFVLLAAGLPRPTTQLEIRTHLGTFRADMGWEEWKLLIEYDGRSKYEGGEIDAFMREKRRADALAEAGYRLLRVTKEDLRTPEMLVARAMRMLPAQVPYLPRPALRAP